MALIVRMGAGEWGRAHSAFNVFKAGPGSEVAEVTNYMVANIESREAYFKELLVFQGRL